METDEGVAVRAVVEETVDDVTEEGELGVKLEGVEVVWMDAEDGVMERGPMGEGEERRIEGVRRVGVDKELSSVGVTSDSDSE